jgi:hypothetical protein
MTPHAALTKAILDAVEPMPDVFVGRLVSGVFSTQWGARVKIEPFGPGTPDMLLIVRSRALFVEVKAGRDVLSPVQLAWRRIVAERGYADYIVARCVGDAVGAVERVRACRS